ncbi:phBC6A51 family helix-turn-helix protein [Bacillus anthracis]|uniref:phBC6A51 family helix-turn-helix protein n=1 Tax=Bacillus anthracis TaxID=1392 RepID=UPI003517D9A1
MKDEYSIKEICILIGIPRSTYYRWKNKESFNKQTAFLLKRLLSPSGLIRVPVIA